MQGNASGRDRGYYTHTLRCGLRIDYFCSSSPNALRPLSVLWTLGSGPGPRPIVLLLIVTSSSHSLCSGPSPSPPALCTIPVQERGKELLRGALDRGDALVEAAGHGMPAAVALRYVGQAVSYTNLTLPTPAYV